MRVFGPVITVAAIALFICTLLSSLLLTIAVPCLALGLGIVACAAGHFYVGIRVIGSVPKAFGNAFDTTVFVARALAHPLRREPPAHLLGYRVPDLLRFSREVAAELGQPGFDDAFLLPSANFGVFEITTVQGPRRVLVAGAPLLFIFTVDELRAVIGHELAHLALGHTAWTRALGRWEALMQGLAAESSESWHPVSLALVFSAWMFQRAAAPWSRARELDADRLAAQHFGAEAMIAALRKTEERADALSVLMVQVAAQTARSGLGPESWTEAAYRRYEALSPADRRALRVAVRDDPFDVDGRTHPPYGVRSRALANVRGAGSTDSRRAIALLPELLVQERKLTAGTLRARRWVAARAWGDEVEAEKRALERPDALDLNTGYPMIDLGD